MEITVSTLIEAPISKVWAAWTTPESIIHWSFASDEWCCPTAELSLTAGETFSYRMEAKDGSMGFDFQGRFLNIIPNEKIEFALDDERKVVVTFEETVDGVRVSETFDAEDQHSAEQQKEGWQSILSNFKKYVESAG